MKKEDLYDLQARLSAERMRYLDKNRERQDDDVTVKKKGLSAGEVEDEQVRLAEKAKKRERAEDLRMDRIYDSKMRHAKSLKCCMCESCQRLRSRLPRTSWGTFHGKKRKKK